MIPGAIASPSSDSSRTSPCVPATALRACLVGARAASACCSSVPMLILWGMKDFVFDQHFLDEWVRWFPAAQVHRFSRAGHYLFEDEADAINEPGAAFLAAHPAIREHVG